MYILEQPQVGGDTIFSNNVEAFNRLSEPFRRILNNLEAVHSGIQLAETNRAQGGRIRREPAINVHPVVRTHPVTNEKSLFVNPACQSQSHPLNVLRAQRVLTHSDVKHIVGFKTEESDAILKYLFEHIATGLDFHVRVKWQENSVVVFDVSDMFMYTKKSKLTWRQNRLTCHAATHDWINVR
jgi:sulfonate dioxygenase